MKIDKVVFASSVEYSPFWNIQSAIYRNVLGIEPVCLLYGKKSETNMSEQWGRVIECEVNPNLPYILQLTWSKFHHPICEPDTVWLMGDIDMIPLQRHHFTTGLADAPDDALLHLNASGQSVARLGITDGFRTCGCLRHGGCDLPAHYFVGKGSQFQVFTQGRNFEEQIRYMTESDQYGLGPVTNQRHLPKTGNYAYYWCAEENYSSELLEKAIKAGAVKFMPFFYNNVNDTQRIDRSGWRDDYQDYTYTPAKVAVGQIVDIHCARPFAKQEAALTRILSLFLVPEMSEE